MDFSKNHTNILLNRAVAVYLFLGGLFIAFLVVCNLIANKFISISLVPGWEPFVISCGVLPYPVTFLITDLLSEFYGRKKTAWVVFTGFVASVFIVLLLKITVDFPAVSDSPASTNEYTAIFGNSWKVIGASMTAYLLAQLVDVHLYEFWRKITKGKYLWIRNNGSTIFSQLTDTFLVVFVLFVGVKSMPEMIELVKDGWLFKIFCAIIDTPIIYGCVFLLRKYLNIGKGEMVKFNK